MHRSLNIETSDKPKIQLFHLSEGGLHFGRLHVCDEEQMRLAVQSEALIKRKRVVVGKVRRVW